MRDELEPLRAFRSTMGVMMYGGVPKFAFNVGDTIALQMGMKCPTVLHNTTAVPTAHFENGIAATLNFEHNV